MNAVDIPMLVKLARHGTPTESARLVYGWRSWYRGSVFEARSSAISRSSRTPSSVHGESVQDESVTIRVTDKVSVTNNGRI